MEYINRKLFKIASYILFKQIIAFNKKWKGITDNMHGKYARDINGQPYIMDYTLEKMTGKEIPLEELELMPPRMSS